jgi:Raf kinase inhibitor-like YbhB/YbcL family protein
MPDLNLGELTITSPVLEHGDAIPGGYAAESGGGSPPLEWTGVPEGTVELVLVVHDPDAPLTDGFTHWVVHGIDPGATNLAEGETGEDRDFTIGRNELGDTAWMGPAPPPGHGTHHYFFHLYAIDRALPSNRPLTRREVLDAIDGHIVEQARLVGTYAQDPPAA